MWKTVKVMKIKNLPKTQTISGNVTKLLLWLICNFFLDHGGGQPVKHLKILNRDLVWCMI